MIGGLRGVALCRACSRQYTVVGLDSVSEMNRVPSSIVLASYHKNGIPPPRPPVIDIKSRDEVAKLREAGHITGGILDKVMEMAQVDITTDELDKFGHDQIVTQGAYPAPLNYRGFPKSICTSVNNVLCHGIPNSRQLQDGDIISIDVSIFYKGVFGDCCSTKVVGKGDSIAHQLTAVAKDSTLAAINQCRPGVRICAVGNTISDHADEAGFSICKEFIGHGIGSYFHGLPEVYHYTNNHGPILRPGMVFTIEPIIMEGRDEMRILSDGWTAVSADTKRAAQFEHTIVITDNGPEILSPHR
ncbi:methionine aminopeptidase 1D, mitochondrial-like isoform X2 [Bolinopsis microptera]|uniref:methionine aminopeptidase 1D, mitochondrial-like isoform X2 n=1 Tax=Bolinopsis microptera TaxID=2820187 RepID=UPI003079585C